MIRSFRHKGPARLFRDGDVRGVRTDFAPRLLRMLDRLDTAVVPDDLDLPGYHFHRLTGDRRGRFSVRVSGNWRLTFGFDSQDCIDVDLEDYD